MLEKLRKKVRPNMLAVLLLLTCATGYLSYEWYLKQTFDQYPIRAILVKSSASIPLSEMPNADFAAGHEISNQEKVALTGEYEDWYFIRTRRGKTGWLKKQYVKSTLDMREIEAARLKMIQDIESSKSKFK